MKPEYALPKEIDGCRVILHTTDKRANQTSVARLIAHFITGGDADAYIRKAMEEAGMGLSQPIVANLKNN